MLFSFLTFQSHAALFRSQGPGETGDHFNIRTAVVETYQNTSRKEWIYRIVQSIAIVIVFCIILASLVTTAGDGDETPTGWWIYVIILSIFTILFLIYVMLFEGWILLHVGSQRRWPAISAVLAEAWTSFFWWLAVIGLIIRQVNMDESGYPGVNNAEGFAIFCAVVLWLSFKIVAYSYWHDYRVASVTQPNNGPHGNDEKWGSPSQAVDNPESRAEYPRPEPVHNAQPYHPRPHWQHSDVDRVV